MSYPELNGGEGSAGLMLGSPITPQSLELGELPAHFFPLIYSHSGHSWGWKGVQHFDGALWESVTPLESPLPWPVSLLGPHRDRSPWAFGAALLGLPKCSLREGTETQEVHQPVVLCHLGVHFNNSNYLPRLR